MPFIKFPRVELLDEDLVNSHFVPRNCLTPPRTSVADIIVQSTSEDKEKEIFVFRTPGKERIGLSRGQVLSGSGKVACLLIKEGVEYGDRIGLLGLNNAEYVIVEAGIIRAGAVVVRLHSNFKSGNDIRYVLKTACCKGLIFHPGLNDYNLELVRTVLPGMEQGDLSDVPKLEFVMDMSSNTSRDDGQVRQLDVLNESWMECDNAEAIKREIILQARQDMIKADDPVSIYLTSGSTGFPKMVEVNNEHVIHFDLGVGNSSELESDDIFLCDRPFSHMGGCSTIAYGLGIKKVILDPRTVVSQGNADFVFQVIQEEKCTSGMFFPYILAEMLDVLSTKRFDISSINKGVAGGQVIPRKFLEESLKCIPKLINLYASTECAGLISTRINDPIEMKLDFTGFPGPFAEFKICDEERKIIPVNKTGELYIKTPFMFLCYLNDEAKTRAAKTADGWYRTDDMAIMNEKGYIRILGRKTEVIIKATLNIYPMAVEKVLLEHPKVDQVVVFGVPDEKLFQEVCACIIPVEGTSLTKAELSDFCDKNLLTEGSVDGLGLRPGYFLIWKQLPLNESGKINRRVLKKVAMKELGLAN